MQSRVLVACLLILLSLSFLTPFWLNTYLSRASQALLQHNLPKVNLRQPLPDFAAMHDVHARKVAFFNYLVPLIDYANQNILKDRAKAQTLRQKLRQGPLTSSEASWLSDLADYYRIPTDNGFDAPFFETLMRRVDIVPPSLILAQAANESAWGTSRFARDGNNLFGEWCYSPGCGITPNRRAAGRTHEVRRFATVYDSLMSYMSNLNRNETYLALRKNRERARQNDRQIYGRSLAAGLSQYSERGDDYIQEIRRMIRHNNLSRYDEEMSSPIPNG